MGEPPKTTSEVIPRSYSSGPEYCLLSEERKPVRSNPQQILLFCTSEGPLPLGALPRRGVCQGPNCATDLREMKPDAAI